LGFIEGWLDNFYKTTVREYHLTGVIIPRIRRMFCLAAAKVFASTAPAPPLAGHLTDFELDVLSSDSVLALGFAPETVFRIY
jgi:hypothetical protein